MGISDPTVDAAQIARLGFLLSSIADWYKRIMQENHYTQAMGLTHHSKSRKVERLNILLLVSDNIEEIY